MTGKIDVSVILSTYNRCDLLDAALRHLINQNPSRTKYEIIVVDNNSNDKTSEIIAKSAMKSPVPFVHLFEPKQGLSNGWNTGIQNSKGSVVALTDDDLIVEQDYVAQVHTAFKTYSEASFLGGKVLPHWRLAPPTWLDNRHWSPLALQDYGETTFFTNIANPVPLVNKAFRREVFTKVGLFRSELGKFKNILGDVADHDLMVRIWSSGGQGIYMPTVIVYADVQEERVSKKYHRKWHNSHGKLSAIMAIRNSDSELFKQKFLCAPKSPYRRLFQAIKAYPSAILEGSQSERFYFETRMRYAINYLGMYYYRKFAGDAAGEEIYYDGN